jgi:hypothetical protein
LSGTTWTAGDPVETATQSDGPHAPGLAGLASELVLGQVGGDKNIYARSFTTAWQDPVEIVDGGIANTQGSNDETMGAPARVIALNGGTAELMLVYTRLGDYKLMSVTRTSGVWSAPLELNDSEFTTEPFQLAALAGGKAIVAWRGSNGQGYVSTYNGTSWTATATNIAAFAINSAPSVAIGNCGSVAVAAYGKAGGIDLVRYDGTSWGTPVSVTTTANMSYVAVAVSP